MCELLKCMVLNFNQSVSEELYFLWNATSKTYATVRLFTTLRAEATFSRYELACEK